MSKNTGNPVDRLKEIKKAPGKLREPDHINEYLKDEEYITVVEVNGKQKKYEVTENGDKILEALKNE